MLIYPPPPTSSSVQKTNKQIKINFMTDTRVKVQPWVEGETPAGHKKALLLQVKNASKNKHVRNTSRPAQQIVNNESPHLRNNLNNSPPSPVGTRIETFESPGDAGCPATAGQSSPFFPILPPRLPPVNCKPTQ
jgi:hypothetical protein